MSNGNVYRVGIEVAIQDKLAPKLKAWAHALEGMERRIQKVKAAFHSLDNDAVRGLTAQVERMERLGATLKGIKMLRTQDLAELRNAARVEGIRNREALKTFAVEQRIMRTLERQHTVAAQLTHDQEKLNSLKQRGAALMPSSGNLIGYGQQLGQYSVGGLQAFAGLGHNKAVEEYQHEQTAFQRLGLGDANNAKALKAAESLRQRVRGLNQADALSAVMDMINVTGSVDEAIKGGNLERFAKFRVANQVSYGLTNKQALDAAKAAEMLTPNRAGMTDEQREAAFGSKMDLINRIVSGTGNRVSGTGLLGAMKTMQSAKMSLTEKGLVDLVPIMQEMGEQRTGTALMSSMQNLFNGRMTTASAENLMKMGLIDTSKVQYDKIGHIKKVLPGGVVGEQLGREDYVEWVRKYLAPQMKGLNTQQMDSKVNSILNNRTAAGLAMLILGQDARIAKDAKVINKAQGVDDSYETVQKGYLGAEAAFEKARETFLQKAAVHVLPKMAKVFNAMTEVMDRINAAMAKDPRLANNMIKLAMGITVLGTAVGGAMMAVGGLRAWQALGVMARGGALPTATAGAGAAGAAEAAAGGAAAAGAARAGGGVLGRVMGAMFGQVAGEAAASPLLNGIRRLGSGVASIGRVLGSGLGSVFGATGARIGGSLLVTRLAPMLAAAGGNGILVAAAAALGWAIGSLIWAGFEKYGIADKITSALAGMMPNWMSGVQGQPAYDAAKVDAMSQANRSRYQATHGGGVNQHFHGPITVRANSPAQLGKDLARAAKGTSRANTHPTFAPRFAF